MNNSCGISRVRIEVKGESNDGRKDFSNSVRTFDYNKRLQELFGFTKAQMTRHFSKNRHRWAQNRFSTTRELSKGR